MLLLIDFLALRSREYHSIIRLYQDWEVSFVVVVVVVFPALFCTSTSVCVIFGYMYACNRHGEFFVTILFKLVFKRLLLKILLWVSIMSPIALLTPP